MDYSVTDEIDLLVKNFRYQSLKPWQMFRVLKNYRAEPVYGDCRAFAATLCWIIAERSYLHLWLNIISFRTVVWLCLTSQGVPHAVTFVKGHGWICNIYPSFRAVTPHTLILPYHPIWLVLTAILVAILA